MESVLLTTSDGVRLEGEIDGPGAGAIGGVVLCHPHPRYGGDRFHPVVDALFRLLPGVGLTVLRFDFRADVGGGDGPERRDVLAAIDELGVRTDGPLHLAGYSFGAVVALAAAARIDRIDRIVAVAPPLLATPVDDPMRPVLVLVPEHDQFTSPVDAERTVASWSASHVEVIRGRDHFLLGAARDVAERAAAWFTDVDGS